MITNRQIQERELRKERILDGALKVFQKQGMENATMDEIAKEADFGKATLYYYFESKEEIFAAILEQGWKKIWEHIEPAIHDHDGPKDTFRSILTTVGLLVNEKRVLYQFLFTAPQSMPEILDESLPWKRYQNRMYGVLRGLIEEGIAKNEFPDVDPSMLLKGLGGLFHGVIFLGHQDEPVSEEAIEDFFTQFLGNIKSS